MSIQSKVIYDHDKIITLIKDIEAMGKTENELRQPMFDRLKKELLILHEAEKHVLYQEPSLAQSPTLINALKNESDTIKSILHAMSKIKLNSKEWHSHFIKLQNIVIRHFVHEEKKLLKKAQNSLDDNESEELEKKITETKESKWKTESVIAPEELTKDFVNSARVA